MSIKKRNKDHLKEHAGVALASMVMPRGDDPLRFWTNHPTENTVVDLHPFADGEFKNPHPLRAGNWGGPFTGRPKLIAELLPALEARCALINSRSVKNYIVPLRSWWRLFDSIENAVVHGGQPIARVESVADLSELHEAAAYQRGMTENNFKNFLSIANDARRLLRLPMLLWEPPRAGDPERRLIPEDQARELKTALKQDWERVRHTWVRNDAIRTEASLRAAGESLSELGVEGERLLMNWQHFQRIQRETGVLVPTGKHILDGEHGQKFKDRGLERNLMRAILFPTLEEANIAFHLALMNSGWNPGTMGNLDGDSPTLVFNHPKDDKQLVLSASDGEDEEMITMQAEKPRARGKTQFCTGLSKHSSSPPVIVAVYQKRVGPLRNILKRDYQAGREELARMHAAGAGQKAIRVQVKRIQELQRGCRSVWLYLDRFGKINWLDDQMLPRYERKGSSKPLTYLGLVLERLNARRALEGKAAIPPLTPSDFRDIYARWVYLQTGGNILAVMLALGHSSLRSTDRYLDNNIFSAENDEHARRFMTHLFAELERGRVDLTILAQLVRHGTLTADMEARLTEYRQLMRSRVGIACADPRHPPAHVALGHVEGRLCGTQRCLRDCPHVRFLPESLDGIAMRVEELLAMSHYLPRETWLRGRFQEELDEGEALLDTLYVAESVAEARDKWRLRISTARHIVPGLGPIALLERTA